MLQVENLVCGYKDMPVLTGVTFSAQPNEKLFVIGPNGCGKTTLLRALAGLIPCSGKVLIEGKEASTLSKKERARKIAMMSQLSGIYFSYSVFETVMQGRYAWLKDGFFKSETSSDRELVLSLLDATGLLPLKDRSIRELSGGQLQRVFLARVFAQEPGIILLDEPTNHLDFRYQLELMNYLDQWVKVPGRIVVGVMHDINLAMSFADRLMILKDGSVLAQDNSSGFNLNLINQIFGADVKTYMMESLKKWER